MPITLHDQPSYELTCDRCGAPAEHDDGTVVLFDTKATTRAWASAEASIGDELLCAEDAVDAANEREHADEIAAAVQYAMGEQL
jgi:hypothetical protein